MVWKKHTNIQRQRNPHSILPFMDITGSEISTVRSRVKTNWFMTILTIMYMNVNRDSEVIPHDQVPNSSG